MAEVFVLALSFPSVVYTVLLGVVLVYWLFVVVGAVNLGDGSADGELDGFDPEGAIGAGKGALEGAAKGAAIDRFIENRLDAIVIFEAGVLQCRGETRIGQRARIRVDFQYPGLLRCINAKVGARVTGQFEQLPAFHREFADAVK